MKRNKIVATCRQNRVRRTLLGFLVTFSLSGFMDGQAFALSPPSPPSPPSFHAPSAPSPPSPFQPTINVQLVQAQSTRTAPFSNQQCTLTFSNGIRSGDTVVGFVHSSNNTDTSPMTPDWVMDNNNVAYVLAGAVQWLPWSEDINIFYLTNVEGNPTSFTFDFSNYSTVAICNVGFAEYSGVSSVVVAGPTLISGTSPSITISPTSPALIWLFAADYGGGFGSLQNSGYTGIIDNWSYDDIGVWSSNSTVPAGSLTLNVNAPRGNENPCDGTSYNGCPTTLAAVALQGATGR
jgi:hypothetical protein